MVATNKIMMLHHMHPPLYDNKVSKSITKASIRNYGQLNVTIITDKKEPHKALTLFIQKLRQYTWWKN